MCCCCRCLCGCCGYIISVICNFMFVVAIFAFFFWLIVRPHGVNFTVNDATLTQFKFTNNITLHYDLALNVTIRNPNRRVGVYYDNIKTLAFYKDVRFGYQTLGTFFQHHKNTSFLNPEFKGQQLVLLNEDQIKEFDKEKIEGVFAINLKILLNVRFKLGVFKSGKAKPKVHCDLKIPLKSHNGSSSLVNGFQATDCDWDYKWRLWQ